MASWGLGGENCNKKIKRNEHITQFFFPNAALDDYKK